jgi:poly-gamma-glutamate synthesis protein (capsule biosynthesis protein)
MRPTIKNAAGLILISVLLAVSVLCSACGRPGAYSSVSLSQSENGFPSDSGCSIIDLTGAVSDSGSSRDSAAPEDPAAAVSINIIMAGDLLMHRFVQISGQKPDGAYDFSPIFANVKNEIASADIAIINQETPLAGIEFGLSGYPLFNAPCEVADAVAGAGFDVVLQATNHALDQGKEGVLACRAYWAENYPDIKIAGTAITEDEAEKICVAESKGIRVAVLNYTYGTNGMPLPSDAQWIVSLLDESKIRDDIARAKKSADFIIVCPHWGVEYSHSPSSGQRRWCDLFLECGADLVIGTHPHVIQPIEWYEDGAGHRMLVFWSIGNFVNSTAEAGEGISDRMLGGMAKVTLTRDADGMVSISGASVIPVVTQLSDGYGGVTVYPFYNYSESMADANILVHKRDPLFSYAYCENVFKEIFGDYIIK